MHQHQHQQMQRHLSDRREMDMCIPECVQRLSVKWIDWLSMSAALCFHVYMNAYSRCLMTMMMMVVGDLKRLGSILGFS